MAAPRDVALDALRVAGVGAVVMMHLSATQLFFHATLVAEIVNGATVWAVPLFFVLSGYLSTRSASEGDRRQWLLRRARRILVPYAFWTAVYLVAGRLLHYPFSAWWSVVFLGGAFSALWFLPALLYVTVLAAFVRRRVPTSLAVPVLIVAYAAAALLLDTALPKGIPGPLSQALTFSLSLLPLLAVYLLGAEAAGPARPGLPIGFAFPLIAALLVVSSAQSVLLGWPRPALLWPSVVWSLLGCSIAYLLVLHVPALALGPALRVTARYAPLVFGTYLTHGLLLMVIDRLLPLSALPAGPWMAVSFAAVTAVCGVLVAALRRLPLVSATVR